MKLSYNEKLTLQACIKSKIEEIENFKNEGNKSKEVKILIDKSIEDLTKLLNKIKEG